MKYSKLIDGVYVEPKTLKYIFTFENVSPSDTFQVNLDFVKSIGWIECPPIKTPVIPVEKLSTHYLKPTNPILENGVLVRKYELIEATAVQLTTSKNRVAAKRDLLLKETDWLTIKASETNTEIPAEWIAYRQALRDITLQAGYPLNIVYPSKSQ